MNAIACAKTNRIESRYTFMFLAFDTAEGEGQGPK